MNTELVDGRQLPLMEAFYSIQGEGFNTGQAAFFIRLGGCDVGCHWCDIKESWKASAFQTVETDEVIRMADAYPAKAVVVTGGEPLMVNLNYLCEGLKLKSITCYLETSGSFPLSGIWDWICLSPKKDSPPLPAILPIANELKVIIHEPDDFTWAEENAGKVGKSCFLYLQPEWSKRHEMMPSIISYIKEHPKWRISIQSHKYMRIP